MKRCAFDGSENVVDCSENASFHYPRHGRHLGVEPLEVQLRRLPPELPAAAGRPVRRRHVGGVAAAGGGGEGLALRRRLRGREDIEALRAQNTRSESKM